MKNIVEMIKTIGKPVELEIIHSWNPSIDLEELKNMIDNSKELDLQDNLVSLKTTNSTLDIEDISYENLMKLIDKYNSKVKSEYANFDKTTFNMKVIRRHLDSRYTLDEFEMTNKYYLFKASRNKNKNFIAICNTYTKEIENELLDKVNDEDLTIYCLNQEYDSDIDYFSFVDTKKIIDKVVQVKLGIENIEIYKIVKELK